MKKEENYVPYEKEWDKEWDKELMKASKLSMVDFIRKLLIQKKELEGKILNKNLN
jgi:hypothetical protein